jgi:hypothetical protein
MNSCLHNKLLQGLTAAVAVMMTSNCVFAATESNVTQDKTPPAFITSAQMPGVVNWLHPDNTVLIMCPNAEPGIIPAAWLVRLASMLQSRGFNPQLTGNSAGGGTGTPWAAVKCGDRVSSDENSPYPVFNVKAPLKDAEVDEMVEYIATPMTGVDKVPVPQKWLFIVSAASDVGRTLYIQLAWVAHYARISADFLDVRELAGMPQAMFYNYSAIAIATDSLPQSSAGMLSEIFKNYVASGGGIADLVGLEDDAFYDLFGITELKSEKPALIKTYRFEPAFLPGAEGFNPVLDADGYDQCPVYNFDDHTTVVVWGGGDGKLDVPMAFIHDPVAKNPETGRTIAWATGRIADKSSRGLILLSLLAVSRHAGAAAIMNSFNLWVDDCPLPMAEQMRPPADKLYNARDDEFYLNIWWPQISGLIEKHGLKPTFAMIVKYDLKTSGQFSTSAYEPMDDSGSPIALARMIHKKGWQIGVHGYNHQSLTMATNEWSKGWPSYQAMRDSLLWFRAEFQRLFGINAVPQVYVAPSNFIQKMGKEALKEAMPEVIAIAGQYLPEESIPGDEFGPDPHVPGVIDIPRISSEYYILGHNSQEYLDGMWVPGIVSHFIHPDDLFDPERSRGFTQEELTAQLDGVLTNVDKHYPFLKRRDGLELARVVKNWPNIELKVLTHAGGLMLSASGTDSSPDKSATVVVRTRPGQKVKIRTEGGCPEVFRAPAEGRYYYQVGKEACRVEFE